MVLAPTGARAAGFACERETVRCDDAVGRIQVSDERNDPIRHGSRHRFLGKRRSDLWHKLARPSMSLSGAVLSPRMARYRHRAIGRRLYRLEGTP